MAGVYLFGDENINGFVFMVLQTNVLIFDVLRAIRSDLPSDRIARALQQVIIPCKNRFSGHIQPVLPGF
jgi:hypothetical protein